MNYSGSMTSVIAGVSVSVAIQVSAEDLRKISGLGQVSSEEEELADLFQRVLREMPTALHGVRESVSRSLLVGSCEILHWSLGDDKSISLPETQPTAQEEAS